MVKVQTNEELVVYKRQVPGYKSEAVVKTFSCSF